MRRLSGWFSVVVGSVLILGSSSAVRAQDGQTGAGTPSLKAPQLNSSATGEVELRPDRATLTLSVESRGVTASKAGSETARRQKQVLDTLRALGIGADQLQTASLQINPDYSNPAPGQRQRSRGMWPSARFESKCCGSTRWALSLMPASPGRPQVSRGSASAPPRNQRLDGRHWRLP